MRLLYSIVVALGLAVPASAQVWSQPFLQTGNNFSITTFVVANDFTLTSSTTLSSMRVWLADRAQSGVLDGVANNFSGTLGWALYANSGGIPSTILFSGNDVAASVTTTGLLSGTGREIFQVDAVFSGAPVLTAGTYWLALRDGTWGSASDGTVMGWQEAISTVGFDHAETANVTNPGPWASVAPDVAFELYAVSVPEPTTIAMIAGLTLCGIGGYYYRRRQVIDANLTISR
ncbi:MAG: PEP-CTERM sorting domain-containing protein [Gemmatales bacterium]